MEGKKRNILFGALVLLILGVGAFLFSKAGNVSTLSLGSGNGQTHAVVFDGNEYKPQNLEIKRGNTIEFRNESDKPFWPASNIHPTHGIYPEFDPQDAVMAGKSWSFRFDKVGPWRYHDHLYPYITGIVTVRLP